jgi:hypothetical protein
MIADRLFHPEATKDPKNRRRGLPFSAESSRLRGEISGLSTGK